jgi:hypothetical protein
MSELCGMADSPRDERLKAKGWARQFTCGEPRLTEACELFESMGKKIHLESMAKEDQPMGASCDACLAGCGDEMKTIWVR